MRPGGFEPPTIGLEGRRSSTELRAPSMGRVAASGSRSSYASLKFCAIEVKIFADESAEASIWNESSYTRLPRGIR